MWETIFKCYLFDCRSNTRVVEFYTAFAVRGLQDKV